MFSILKQFVAISLPLDQADATAPISDSTRTLVVSYLGIRRAIGLTGLCLPVLLGPIGWLVLGIELQDNISSYYHTPLRDVFVGAMCSIAIFLFCYRGYDWIESWTANIGCIAALGVALCPIDANRDPLHPSTIVGLMHTLSGGVFFMTLAFYSLYHFPSRQDDGREEEPHVERRNFIYRASGMVILLSMFAMGSYLFLLPPAWVEWLNNYNFLFLMEWVAVWSFAGAWLTKGRAIFADIAVDLMSLPAHLLHRKH